MAQDILDTSPDLSDYPSLAQALARRLEDTERAFLQKS